MRDNIIKKIDEENLIVIVRNVEKSKLLPLAHAMYDGGVCLLELTYSADKSVSDEEIAARIKMLADEFNGKMLIGAGTVLTTKQVKLTHEAGGKFIISPDTNPEIISETIKLGMVSMPGAITPTEIVTAHNSGADFVKIFPATNFGPDYIKAVKAPLSNVKLTAVGGIDENTIPQYLKAGVSCFGVGTNIVDKKLLSKNDYSSITILARKYISAIKVRQ